jgi:hypothetical protein
METFFEETFFEETFFEETFFEETFFEETIFRGDVLYVRLMTSSQAATVRGLVFYRELPQIYTIAFFRDHQRVVIQGKYSSWRQVLSGVPQGSVLGPVLFSIFINDLDSAATIRQFLKKFADDTKLGQIVNSVEDVRELQDTLNRLCEWADMWGMAFNVQKCHVMHVGRNNPRAEYSMNGVKLDTTEM